MDEGAAKELSDMFAAYREYGAANREAALSVVHLLLGVVMVAGVVAVSAGSLGVCAAAAAGLFALLVLHARSVGRKVSARTRVDAILDKKLTEIAEMGRIV